jgi:predicted RNA-binding protein YlqC (UPF0109 family)
MIRTLVEEIVKSIVDSSERVEITETQQADGTRMIAIKIADTDLGKVIGRNGQTIKAIRAVVYAVNPYDKEIMVDIAS